MRRQFWFPLALTLGALALGGCPKPKPVDVSPIAAADQTIAENESQLIGQRGVLQREQKKLAVERADLVDRRKQLGNNSPGQAALDDQERKLFVREDDLASQESQINGKLDELLRQRGELVQRITSQVGGAAAGDPLERAARREQGVAGREKEIAKREAEVADRERALTEREAKEIRRERESCSAVAVAPMPKFELPKGLKYSAHDVEPTYKKALKLMDERGLTNQDLPAGAAKLADETREDMKKGDFARGKYEADQLLNTVEEIKVDGGFIRAKMARLSAAMHGKKLDTEQRKSVDGLFQGATADYGDGKFSQANSKLNRLFSSLR